MKIVYLQPHSAFQYPLRSDTVWGLLCWGIRTVYSEQVLVDFLSEYDTPGGGLKISSCFPYKEDGEVKVPYFPKPFGKPTDFFGNKGGRTLSENTRLYSGIKKYKKVSLLPENFFFRYIAGKESEDSIFADPDAILNPAPKIESVEMMHNTINRLSGSTGDEGGGLFSREMKFTKNAGLFCLMDGTPAQLEKAEAAFRFLAHFGFAGDASTGSNHFRVTVSGYSVQVPEGANAFMTLSLYVPAADELQFFLEHDAREKSGSLLMYELMHRKGKKGGRFSQHNHFWSESVFAFAEGSVFPLLRKPQLGSIVAAPTEEPNPGYTPKRTGVAFDIPIVTGGAV